MTQTSYTLLPKMYDRYVEYKLSVQYIKDKYAGDLYKACEDDPVLFARYMLNIKLRDYQIYMMDMLKNNRFMFFLLFRRAGKEQPISSNVLTIDGFKKMGNIQLGDVVRTPDNKTAKVTGIFPQGIKDVYRLTFNDGNYVECGLNHLWKYYRPSDLTLNKKNNTDKHRITELKEILDFYKQESKTKWVATKSNYIAIETTKPLDMGKKKDFLINPYLMGSLLGDGSFRDNQVSYTTSDLESIKHLDLPDNYKITKKSGHKYDYRISKIQGRYNLMHKTLKNYGLWDKKSEDKHIPKDYLNCSKEQRIELLKGLMDTDGSIDKEGRIEFSSASKQLAYDVKFLIESLGGVVTLNRKENKCLGCYRLYIRIGFNPFKLTRKAIRYTQYYNGRDKYRYVQSIEIVRKEESQCIMIDSKEHLYLTDNFVPTHNTTIYKIFSAWVLTFDKYPSSLFQVSKVIVIAHAVKMAKSYIKEIRDMFIIGDMQVAKIFKGKLGNNFFTSRLSSGRDKGANTTESLTVKNLKNPKLWNSIEVYPPKDTVRGDGASVMILDELSSWYKYTPNVNEIYDEAVKPVITDNNYTKIFIATTPKGSSGVSYELMPVDGHKSVYKLIWFPYYVRTDPEYLKSMEIEKQDYINRNKWDAFRQEFLTELVSIDNAYFSQEHIKNVFEKEAELLPLTSSDLPLHGAIDFGGKRKSRTVITLSYLDTETNQIYRVYDKRYAVGKDDTLQDDIKKIAQKFPNIKKWNLDDQGAGTAFYGWIKKQFGASCIDEVSFRRDKEALYTLFKIACFQNRLKTYHDDELRQEFLTFTNNLKPSGEDDTDDLLDSFMLSVKDWLSLAKKQQGFNNINQKILQFRQNGKITREWSPSV